MYYDEEKHVYNGEVFSISVDPSITYMNENRNTTCFRKKLLKLKKKMEYVCVEWTFSYIGPGLFGSKVNLECKQYMSIQSSLRGGTFLIRHRKTYNLFCSL